MNSGKTAMCLVMLGIFAGMVGIATQYPPQARFMPLVVGIPGIALCILQLVLERSVRGAAAAPAVAVTQGMTGSGSARRREAVLWASFISLIASLILFGFWLTIPLFLVAFLRFYAKASWRFSLALGVGGTLAFFLVFHQGLGVVLHNGFVTDFLVDRIGAA